MSAQPLASPDPETTAMSAFPGAPERHVATELLRFVVLALATGLGLSLLLTVGGLLFAAATAGAQESTRDSLRPTGATSESFLIRQSNGGALAVPTNLPDVWSHEAVFVSLPQGATAAELHLLACLAALMATPPSVGIATRTSPFSWTYAPVNSCGSNANPVRG